LVADLLGSPIEGLILDYKSDSETLLDRDELDLLKQIIDFTEGTAVGFIKRLLPF